jgi:hypothetical protein
MRVIGAAGITEDVPSFLLPRISFGAHSRNSITAGRARFEFDKRNFRV